MSFPSLILSRVRVCVFVLLFLSSVALAQVALAQDAPRVHVTRVEGPIARRAIVRALRPNEIRECQHTHMGRPIRFVLTINPSGVASASEVLAHEEVRSYMPCVQQYLSRLRFESHEHATRTRIAIFFQPSGVPRP